MKKLSLSILLMAVSFADCFAQTDLDFLEGTWKVEGEENYETWKRGDEGYLTGEFYTIEGGKKVISEKLAIKPTNGKVLYEPTVFNHNEGKTIFFMLNDMVKDKWSFENPEHDFPTRIIYDPKGKNRVYVQVLGPDGKGFAMNMDRQ